MVASAWPWPWPRSLRWAACSISSTEQLALLVIPPSIVILTHPPKLKQSSNFSPDRKASRFLDRTDSVATNLLLQFKKQTSV